MEGPHALIGGDIASRYGVNRVVCNAIAAHHQEVEQESIEATVVQIADAISASRPGARGESLDNYVKRLDDLQQIALSFPGVERCYAIQAGREIRILVRPEDMDDLASSRLARDVVQEDRGPAAVPGPDQGDGHPRDAGRGLRAVTDRAALLRCMVIGDIIGKPGRQADHPRAARAARRAGPGHGHRQRREPGRRCRA